MFKFVCVCVCVEVYQTLWLLFYDPVIGASFAVTDPNPMCRRPAGSGDLLYRESPGS
jgi:hypothetical protein